jgi:undecaprenyl diphosphate synthase
MPMSIASEQSPEILSLLATAGVDPKHVPAHVALIMDGNGRWARQRNLPRFEGHRRGYKTAQTIVRFASQAGVKVLTLYVFSIENWRRPKSEVDALMWLIENTLRAELPELHANNVRVVVSGRRSGLSVSMVYEIDRSIDLTKANTGLTLNLALNYGGRAEIVDAVRSLASRVASGEIAPGDIDEAAIAHALYNPDLPDPDLLVRTAGEMRVSNFLLWGVAYSELWVTQTLWPDFTPALLLEAIADYQRRERKFGKVESV